MYKPMPTNGMPQSTKKGPAPETSAPSSQNTANPPHMMLKGTRNTSAGENRTAGSGRPDQSNCSRGRKYEASCTEASSAAAPAVENGDLDGARLIALNMALNGESRADTERYLAEHFQLSERQRLVDEVYAAIET